MKALFTGTIKNGKFEPSDIESYQIWIDQWSDGTKVQFSVGKEIDSRTSAQNNAIHLYLSRVAEALNSAGLTIEKVIKYFTIEHDWTTGTVKEIIWREAQRFAVGKESTTDLDKAKEIDKTYEVVNRLLAKMKVESIPFPSEENRFNKISNE